MNTDIMQWASTAMYQDRLVAHSSVASHLLHQMQGVTTNEDTGTVHHWCFSSLKCIACVAVSLQIHLFCMGVCSKGVVTVFEYKPSCIYKLYFLFIVCVHFSKRDPNYSLQNIYLFYVYKNLENINDLPCCQHHYLPDSLILHGKNSLYDAFA